MNNNIPRKSQTLAKSLRTKASISERRRPFNYLLGCEIYWISLLQKTANFLRKDITLIVRNHLYASLLKSISVNAKILILFYKISMYLCIYKDSFGAKKLWLRPLNYFFFKIFDIIEKKITHCALHVQVTSIF